ncbi:hypothetical protein LC605_20345 [Nostoc sp. CHAB 5836]|nr:hypothetical protein [Nostoc sp. CHAB 5836]
MLIRVNLSLGEGHSRASCSWGKPPDALYETLRERGLANAALLPLASPLLPKGEASAKGEDRTSLAIQAFVRLRGLRSNQGFETQVGG